MATNHGNPIEANTMRARTLHRARRRPVEPRPAAGRKADSRIGVVFLEEGQGTSTRILGLTALDRCLLGLGRSGVDSFRLVVSAGVAVPSRFPEALAGRVEVVERTDGESELEVLRRLACPGCDLVTWRSNLVIGPKDAAAIGKARVRAGHGMTVESRVHVFSAGALVAGPATGSALDLAAQLDTRSRLDRMAETILVREFTDDTARKDIEDRLVRGLLKPVIVDGVVGYYVFRPVSTRLSRVLTRFPITPNQITLLAMALGVVGGLVVGMGGWAAAAIGSTLYFLGALVDCIDGELARLKFQFSPAGEWLDTISDDVSTVVFIAGMAANLADRYSTSMVWAPGGIAIACMVLGSAYVYYKLITEYGTGDLTAFQYAFLREDPNAKPGVMDILKYAVKRDLFSALFFVAGVCGLLEVAFVPTVVGAMGFLLCVVAHILYTTFPAPQARLQATRRGR
jgi:phosphatidylglycerophosphate synthase